MYNNYFGFSESPFNITPNARIYHRTQSCEEILRIVQHGIESRKGVMVVTGEPGTGKTLLVKFLARDLSPKIQAIVVQNPRADFDRMLQLVLERLDLQGVGDDRTARLDRLTCHLVEQRRQGVIACLLVDEAQDLDASTLDELRLLANLEFEGDALLPIVLIGQPDLNLKLDHPSAIRIKQRIALTRSTHALVRMELGPYIRFRLKLAGYDKDDLFDPEAIDAIAAYSAGIPRLVNSICDNSLIRAYAANQSVISAEIIEQVARDLRIIASFPLDRQFTRVASVTRDSRPQADAAAYGAQESNVLASEQPGPEPGIHDPCAARAQDSILPKLEKENLRENAEADRAAEAKLPPKSDADGRPSVHTQTNMTRDLLPVRLRWYAIAPVGALFLLILNTINSSHLGGIYSSAAAKRTTLVDATPYQALHRDALYSDSVEVMNTLVGLSSDSPTAVAPRRAAPAEQPVGIPGGQSIVDKNPNEKKAGAIKAARTRLPRDGELRRDEGSDFSGRGNGSQDPPKVVKVVATSLLRKKPSASAEIITSLEPGSRITVLAKSGDFYHVRSVDKKPIQGYVHREDAFFERKK